MDNAVELSDMKPGYDGNPKLPVCPDCGGEIVWYEAGYVPGTRKCQGCGSMFSVQVEAVTEPPKGPERFSFGCDNGHRWEATEAEDKAADH